MEKDFFDASHRVRELITNMFRSREEWRGLWVTRPTCCGVRKRVGGRERKFLTKTKLTPEQTLPHE